MKTELNHTKGNWNVLMGNYGTFCSINKDSSCRVATIQVPDGKEHDGCAPISEARANAYLIAAAPELLESLNDLIEKLSPYVYKRGVKKGFSELVALEAAKKAIRKATEYQTW